MLVQLLACEFVARLRAQIGLENMAVVVNRNIQEENAEVCHSHDFCDANMVMFEAFVAVMGREPGFAGREAMQDADLELVDRAWNLAKMLLAQEFEQGGGLTR